VLESGRTIVEGISAELLRSAEVKRIFLGDDAVCPMWVPADVVHAPRA
jgi:hypothetical protein